MNKLFTKIVGACLGLTMAVGVGVAVASNREATKVDAATIGTHLTQVTSLTSGNQYVIVGNDNGYALPTNPTVSSGKVTGTAIANVPNDGAGYLWTITQSGDYWLIGDGSKYIYHSNGGNSGTNLAYGTSQASYPWQLTYSTSGQAHWTFAGVVASGPTVKTRGMLVNGTNFGGYALSNESSYKYMNIYEVAATPQTISGETSAYTDETVTLSSDATTTVTWSIVTADTTAAGAAVTSSGVVSVTGAGSVKVKAVASGYADATHTITFSVRPAGTYYDVTFDSNGGSSSPAKQSIEENATFTFPSPGTKTHYSFDGWSSDGGTTLFDEGDTSPAVVDDIEYTAYWQEDAKVTVTYSAGTNATGSYSHTNQYVGSYSLLALNSLSGITYDSTTYRLKDYVVGGVSKQPGDSITLSAATTVTVNFEEIPLEYTVTFGTAEGTSGITEFNNSSYVIPSGVTLDNIQGNVYSNTSNQAASLRFGKSGTTGSFDASITGNYYIVSVKCNLKYYGTDTTATFAVTPAGGEAISKSLTGSWADYTYDVSAANVKKVTLGTDVNGKRAYLSGFTITYAAQAVLDSVTSSGQTTSFTQGGSFAYGGTLTAHYTQGKADATVTPTAYKIGDSGFNPASAGTAITIGTTLSVDTHNGKYIAVGYTEGGITKWSALYQITVSYAAVSSLTLDSNTGKVATTELFDMSEIGVTILPSNAVQTYEWTVLSNTVSNDYTFEADIVEAGNTEGTITLKCTSTADSSKYQTFVLTVSGSPVVSLPNSVSLYSGKTTTVTASVEGGTSPYSYSWSITSGGSYASISSGGSSATVTLSGTAAGSVTLQCSVTDANSKSDSASVTFSVTASAVTSVSWSASAFDVFSGATIPEDIDDTWEVNYEKNNGDNGYLVFGEYDLYLGEDQIDELPYTFEAADSGKTLYVEYGGVSSSSVAVTVTQTINNVNAPVPGKKTTSTLTFEAACSGSGTSDGGEEWTVTSDGTESTYDPTKGIHYGTGSAAVQYINLTSSDFTSGKITKVVVNASTASSVTATVAVNVGGSAFGGDAQSLSSSAAEYTFNGEADADEIEVIVTKPSSAAKAIYCKSIAVTYEEGGEGSVNIANDASHKAAQRVAVKFAKAFNEAMDDTENCTTGLSAAWSTCSSAYDTFKSEAAALGSTEEAYAKNLVKYATAQYSDDSGEACIERMMKTYEVCVQKHSKTAFMSDLVSLGRAINTNPLTVVNDTNVFTIIVVISMVSVTVVGGYFFLRKRKEN